MSHNIGRVVTISATRIGPDGPLAPVAAGVWEYPFTPGPALVGGTPRFVILHLTSLALPGTSRVEVELGYGKDVITAAAGTEAWSRPVDPLLGPVIVRFVGAAGGVTLAEYGSGEPWTTTYVTTPYLDSITNGDLFLHTNPYQEPTYQKWLQCGGVFDWQNAACSAGDAIKAEAARAVGVIVNYHKHDGQTLLSSCSVTLIDTNLVLTARHCVNDPSDLEVRSGSVTFDYATSCAGDQPVPYSPMFHKVRAVRARGNWPATMEGDWAILEIDPPPVGIIPRQLRAGAVPNEAVFTVHHPNGAVKKLQSGSLPSGSVAMVQNFDYAGGSSGSALFDAMGRVIGAALSAGAGGYYVCQVGYSSAGAVLTALANPPVPSVPVDMMLVLDRSGSMVQPGTSGPGRTKMVEAREGASLFVQLVRVNAGDRMGMVSFSTTATSPADTSPGQVNPGKKNQLVGPNPPYDGGTIGALAPGGMTSIGDGLQEAIDSLTGLSASANQRAILLLTDGKQNTAPLVAAVDASLGTTQVYAIGFGNEAQLDGALLDKLARDHAGLYTRANDGLELQKFFALAFGNIFVSGSLVDPELILRAGQAESEDVLFDVCDEDQITVVVGWQDPAVDLEAIVVTPTGGVVPMGGAVEVDTGPTWWFAKVPLPLLGEREGAWRVRVRRRAAMHADVTGGSAAREPQVRLFVSILADGGPRMRPLLPARRLYTGDRVTPQVALLYDNGTAPHARVELTISGPGVALGALVARQGLSEPDVGEDPVDAFSATLQRIAAAAGGRLPLGSSRVAVELFDDGVHEDGAMDRDGVYGNPLDGTLRYEGTYAFRAVARYGETCRGQRETTWSVHVDVGIDPGKTGVEIVPSGAGPDGKRVGTVRITPRDAYGSPLGPGRGDRFRVTAQAGTIVRAPVRDNGDGSYDIPVAWDAAGAPGLLLGQPERDPVALAVPVKRPWWCVRPWVIGLLVAAGLVLLILWLISLLA